MNLFGKNKKLLLVAPVQGKTLPLSAVPDQTFSMEILGQGVALLPENGQIFAPCDARVDLMFETGHAVNLITQEDVEILIHVGIDTVNLKGRFFNPCVKTGDRVKQGDLLLTFDLKALKDAGYHTHIPVVICNSAKYSTVTPIVDKPVNNANTILILE